MVIFNSYVKLAEGTVHDIKILMTPFELIYYFLNLEFMKNWNPIFSRLFGIVTHLAALKFGVTGWDKKCRSSRQSSSSSRWICRYLTLTTRQTGASEFLLPLKFPRWFPYIEPRVAWSFTSCDPPVPAVFFGNSLWLCVAWWEVTTDFWLVIDCISHGCVWKWCTPLYPMVLLIIIPIKWLFHWEYTLFSDKPTWFISFC